MIPARIALPTTPHHKTCQVMPVNRRRRAGNLTRLHPVKPCRRGRRRSQGGRILVRGHPCPLRFAHHATSQDVSRQDCRPRPTCGKSHSIASCGTLPARAPALPGGLILVRGHPCPHRFAHHAPSQDVSRQACRPKQTGAKSHPIASCETLPARAPALPGGPHPGPRASLPASLCPPRHITRRVKS